MYMSVSAVDEQKTICRDQYSIPWTTHCPRSDCKCRIIEYHVKHMLAIARKLTASQEILLWMTPSEAPKALQASECSELLDPMRASCWISAQH